MDLRNNNITVGELLDNPKSRAVFQRRFGRYLKHPMVGAARSLSLAQLADQGRIEDLQGQWLSPVVEEILR